MKPTKIASNLSKVPVLKKFASTKKDIINFNSIRNIKRNITLIIKFFLLKKTTIIGKTR